jgi:hypothetical protein
VGVYFFDMEGWIKLHRSFLEHWLCDEYRPLTKREAWETMLFTVNYEDKKSLIKGQLYTCERGQSLLSLQNWAEKFTWSIQNVRSFFKLLESDSMIILEGLQYTTRLTICNYDKYQDNQQTDNTPPTDEQQTANRPPTTTKESKEDKEIKNKESVDKSTSLKILIKDRELIFYNQIAEFKDTYPKELLRKFFDYWREKSKSGKKMRFEIEPTWDLSLRLKKWESNNDKFNKIDPKQDITTTKYKPPTPQEYNGQVQK